METTIAFGALAETVTGAAIAPTARSKTTSQRLVAAPGLCTINFLTQTVPVPKRN
jgi:hypothetical protein